MMDIQSFSAPFSGEHSVSQLDLASPNLALTSPVVISYHDLYVFLSRNMTPGQIKSYKTYLIYWIENIKKTLLSPVGNELNVEFDRYFSAFRNALERKKYKPKTVANAATLISKLRAEYLSWLENLNLPQSFPEALRLAITRAGYTLRGFKRAYLDQFGITCNTLRHWLDGTKNPDYPRSRKRGRLILQRMEILCGLAPDTLCSRVFTREPVLLLLPPLARNKFRDFHSFIVNNPEFNYSLRPLPEHLQQSFDQLVKWKSASRHYVGGTWLPVSVKERWSKQASIDINLAEIESFFGFLLIPTQLAVAPSVNASSLLLGITAEERLIRYSTMRTGMGMKLKDLRFTMLVDHLLLEKYALFRQARNAHEFITDNMVANIIHKAGFVLKDNPNAFIRAHPEFRKELTPTIAEKQWNSWCDKKHTELRNLINTLNKTVSKVRTRMPSAPVEHVLDNEDPVAVITRLGYQLLNTLPPPSCVVSRALQYRNGMIILLMLFEPLRARHWPRLEIGKQIVRDQNTGRWKFDIKAEEFKNHLYGHAKDRLRVLPQILSDIVEEYVSTYRRHLYCPEDAVSGQLTNIFLLKSRTGDSIHRNVEPWLTADGFYNLFSNIFERYLGNSVGPHVMRHIVTTAWLLENKGDYVTGAAMLNDSAFTVQTKYSHLTHGRVLNSRDQDLEEKLNALATR